MLKDAEKKIILWGAGEVCGQEAKLAGRSGLPTVWMQ